jgi:hypothetical protein
MTVSSAVENRKDGNTLRIIPKSSEEIASMQVFPRGTYQFEVIGGEDKVSQALNPMIELKLKVTNSTGASRFVTDYLLEKLPIKLRHAAEACGLLEQYEAGDLAGTDFVGKTGELTLAIEKDKNRKFPDKNSVIDYVVKESGVAGIKFLRRRQS